MPDDACPQEPAERTPALTEAIQTVREEADKYRDAGRLSPQAHIALTVALGILKHTHEHPEERNAGSLVDLVIHSRKEGDHHGK